jgi:hypothetical protein
MEGKRFSDGAFGVGSNPKNGMKFSPWLDITIMSDAFRHRGRVGSELSSVTSKIKNLGGRGFLVFMVGLLFASGLRAQSADEHASHHPAAAGAGATPAMPGPASAMGAMPTAGGGPRAGGMGPPAGVGPPGGMGDMGAMMKGMGAPPPKELYPSLMALPELTPGKRLQIEQQASERIHAGSMLMGQALDTLNAGTRSGDYAAMHEAMSRLREGTAQLESGIAARRALAEGRAPREVALAWFKREMSLVSPYVGADAHNSRGLSPLHLFTMALLIVFAATMLAMYFFKMRRASALFGRIEPDKGSPPPGSAPELAGGKPPGGDRPSSGDKPPAAADKPVAPADKPATDAPPKAS